MPQTVFWSWQSDQPSRETRSVIRDALTQAIERVAGEMDEADRPELDHDTRGVAGSPDIVATILSKIERAGVFVADITPIAISEDGKHVANPNVLIELGYAKRAIGTERVILVWNTAISGTTPEHLPFDMRHRRAPIGFDLPVGSSRTLLRQVRDQLAISLERAIRDSFATIAPTPPPEPPWQLHEEGLPSIWTHGNQPLTVNRGFDGAFQISVENIPRGYARMLPSNWTPRSDALSVLEGQTTHLTPLGRVGSMDWGPTTGGFLVYRSSESINELGITPTATRWFKKTGEIWGVASTFFDTNQDSYYFASTYAVKRWLYWIKHHIDICRILGGIGPYHIRLGLDGLKNTIWHSGYFNHSHPLASLEAQIEHTAILTSGDETEIMQVVKGAYDAALGAYGLPESSEVNFQNILTH